MCLVNSKDPRMCFELKEVPPRCLLSDFTTGEHTGWCVTTVQSLLSGAGSTGGLAVERRERN